MPLFLGSFALVPMFFLVIGFVNTILGSGILGGVLVSCYKKSSLLPVTQYQNLICSYRELLEEAEKDLKEAEAELTVKSKKLEEIQKQLEALPRNMVYNNKIGEY